MSFASKVLYTGDGVVTQFNVPMPYLSKSHISVYVNEILMLELMHYTWSGDSTIIFVDPPGIDSAIEIKRNSSPSATLVDFINGSVLNETDLDTAYLHNFYLQQEFSDSFNEVINEELVLIATGEGIVETETALVIPALVQTILAAESAAVLQSRIADIDTNAEAIITLGEGLQVQINTLATGIAADVYIQAGEPIPGVAGVPDPIPEGARWYDTDDNNKPYIYQSSAWLSIEDPRIGAAAANISVLQVDVVDNAAAIVAEQVVRANADSAFSSELSLIGAQNVGQTAFVIDLNTAYVGPTESLATRFTSLSAADSTNAADIVTETNARVAGDSAVASTVTTLAARVTTTEGDIVTNASAISSEQTTRANADSALAIDITQLEAASTATDINVAANAASIVAEALVASNATSAVASDVSALDARITSNTGDITANAGLITNNTASVAINTGNISANTSSITSLSSEVDLRNRTFRQALAPTAFAVGDLWIDSDDNVLYRWNGTAWTNAQDLAIAANASAVNAVDARVDITDGNVTANANDITSLTATVGTNTGNIATVTADVAINTGAITTANGNIAVNASDITTLAGRVTSTEGSIVTANANIALNVTAISNSDGNIASNAALITALQNSLVTTDGNVSANTAGVAALVVDLSSTDGNVTANALDITQLEVDVDLRNATFIQALAPVAYNVGDLWIDSDDNQMYRWNGTSWVAIQDAAISANASAVTALTTRVTTAEGTISSNSSSITALSSDITTVDGRVDAANIVINANASAISGLTTDVSTANGNITANANSITTLSSRVTTTEGDIASAEITIGGHTTSISTLDGEVLSLGAKYGVTLNVNGYITGYAINSGPTSSTFEIMADNFAIRRPSDEVAVIYWDGVLQTLQIQGDLIVTGTINGQDALSTLSANRLGATHIGDNSINTIHIGANQVTAAEIQANTITSGEIFGTNLSAIFADLGSITAGNITLDTSGFIKGGQTAYNTGTGFWLGYDTSAWKFSLGNTSNYLKWDGTTLTVKGDLVVGEYESSTNIILSATTERTDSGPLGGYTTYKTFTIAKDGAVKVTVEYKHGAFTGGVNQACQWQVTVNGVQDTTWSSSTDTTYATRTIELTGLSAGDVIDIDMIGGERNPAEPFPVTAYMRNAYIKADVVIAPGGSVDLN